MQDQTIRTTINLPRDLHKQLRLQAINQGVSMNHLVLKKIQAPDTTQQTPKSTDRRRLAQELAGSLDLTQTNWAGMTPEERQQQIRTERKHADRLDQ